MKLSDFNDKHLGETIYIIGCAANLNNLSASDKEYLKDKTTIGVSFAYEGIDTLTYSISAHIAPAVYLFEYARKDMPIFVAYNEGQKRDAFSYMKDFFWDDNRIVVFSSEPPKIPLLKKKESEDIFLRGNTSILLLATHLAYIMGASKLVYIGFEELKSAHFWNSDKALEIKMEKNIKNILDSKKYWYERYYYNNDIWSMHHNVHKEFEWKLENIFNLSEEKRARGLWDPSGAKQNIYNFANYVSYLNQQGVDTYTLSHEGVTNSSGCKILSSVII
jgi:hypothetical protein